MNNYEAGVRYVVRADGVAVKKPGRSNKGLVIEGVATKYSTIMYESTGRYVNIMPGAFDISLKYPEAPIQLRLDHDKKLAMPGCRIELFSDEEGLNFRAHLDDSELACHARDLVQAKIYTQVSLGWHSSVISKRQIGDHEVNFILRGTLKEVSILPSGAVPSTHCEVKRLSDCGTLEKDCKSFRMKSDNDFVAIRRALQKLESA
jgi:HK97 family phage prohead protease